MTDEQPAQREAPFIPSDASEPPNDVVNTREATRSADCRTNRQTPFRP